MPTINVIGNKVLVRFREWKEEGIIHIPDKYKPQPVEADVVAVGPKAHWAIEPGQKVLVSRMVGTYFDFDGDRVCLVPDSGIILIDEVDKSPPVVGKQNNSA